jgi:ABC-type Fe3+-hydroxamate transport system substrate-binding protein
MLKSIHYSIIFVIIELFPFMNNSFTDQLGRKVSFDFPPQKIISLVPSQTELLFYLGLDAEVIGITKFCVHPKAQFRIKTKIGGTKNLNLEKIAELQPDLIIGNKEENEQSQIDQLSQHFPVWMSDIIKLEDAFEMIEQIGRLTNRSKKAGELNSILKNDFSIFEKSSQAISPKSVAYFIWRKPFMVAANGTFINEMLKIAGFRNIYSNLNRYPEISLENLAKANPEVILLSSEPFPFKEKHIFEIREFCPDSIIKIVDGEMFSWYGNRLLLAVRYFETLRKEL